MSLSFIRLQAAIKSPLRSGNQKVCNFYIKIERIMLVINFSGRHFPYKINTWFFILFKDSIGINSMKTLVICYFCRYDETNIAMRKRLIV